MLVNIGEQFCNTGKHFALVGLCAAALFCKVHIKFVHELIAERGVHQRYVRAALYIKF